MQGLMQLCRNWGSSDCQNIVASIMFPREALDTGSTMLGPDRDEQEPFDSNCATCEKRNFLIEKNGCLVCSRKELHPAPLSQIHYTSGTEYLYECPGCQTNYYSYQDLT
jgi:hypothetical protein